MLLNLETVPAPYKKYVKLVVSEDVVQALRISGFRTQELIHSIAESKVSFRYAPGKWTIGEVFEHLIDLERVFAYRALLFARGEKVISYSFDQDMFVSNYPGEKSLSKLADELMRLRTTTLDLFSSFTPSVLQRQVVLNSNEITVELLGFCIAGHETHHRYILEEKYVK